MPIPGYRAAVLDEDGYFHHQSRTDDMIISAGYNIAGPEIESALMLHSDVADYAAAAALARELQDFVKQRIAPYKYPRAIEFASTLPRTETGKLQRYLLRAPAARRAQNLI